MTDQQVATSEIDVRVTPEVAFRAFTDEMDMWWVRGPINFHNAGRVVAMRCEPGVGGRVGEVLDDLVIGEMKELARITVWQPGERLAWASSIDDVETEVRFQATSEGTRVVVEHRLPAGGQDRGGTAWSRVVPNWFGRWCERRDAAPHQSQDIGRLALALYYQRPSAAAHFLADTFQLKPVDPLPVEPDPLPEGEHGGPWIEFRAGDASIMVFALKEAASGTTHVPWIYVDDLDAHLAHAELHGAVVVSRKEWSWLPTYVAEDLEGHRWTFAQARPTQR